MPGSKHFSPSEPKYQTTTLTLGDGFSHLNQQRGCTVFIPQKPEITRGYGAHLARLAVIQNDSDLEHLLNATGHTGVFNYFKASASTSHHNNTTQHDVRLGMLLVCETRREVSPINSDTLHPDLIRTLPAADPKEETERLAKIDELYLRFGDSAPTAIVYGHALLVLMTIKSETREVANQIMAHFRAQAKQVSTGFDLARIAKDSKKHDAIAINIESTGVKPANEYKDLRDFKHLVDDFLKLFDTENAEKSIIPLHYHSSSLERFFPSHLPELAQAFHAICEKTKAIQIALKERKKQIKSIMDFYFQLRDNNTNKIKYQDNNFDKLSQYESQLMELKAKIKTALKEIGKTSQITKLPFDEYEALINTTRETLSSILSLDALPKAAECTLIHALEFSVKPWEKLTPLIGRRRRLHTPFSLTLPEGTETLRLVLTSNDHKTLSALNRHPIYLKRKNRYRHEIIAGPFFNSKQSEYDIPLNAFAKDNPDTPFEDLYFASAEDESPDNLFAIEINIYAAKPSVINNLPSSRTKRDDIYSERFTRDIFGTSETMPAMARGRRDSDLSRIDAPAPHLPTHVQSAPARLPIPSRTSSEHSQSTHPSHLTRTHRQSNLHAFFQSAAPTAASSTRSPSQSSLHSAMDLSRTETEQSIQPHS